MTLASYKSLVLADGATSLWPLQETSGTNAVDEGPNGNDGTHTGSEITVGVADGPCGDIKSVFYDPPNTVSGTSGTVIGDFAAYETSDFTLELWVKGTPKDSNFPPLMDKSFGPGQYALSWVGTSGWIDAAVFDTGSGYYLGGTTGAPSNDSKWHHVVMSVDGTTPRLDVYVDGDLKLTDTTPSGTRQTTGTGPLVIGGGGPSAGALTVTFQGYICLGAYYDIAIDAATVLAHYNELCAAGGWHVGDIAIGA